MILFVFVTRNIQAQENVGIGTVEPHQSALLDLDASDKGVLFPRVALSEETVLAGGSNPIGVVVFNNGEGSISTKGFYFWSGNRWELLALDSTLTEEIEKINQKIQGLQFPAISEQWIYMPAFPIKMHEASEQKVYLYDEYSKQLGDTSGMTIWEENEVKFVVTGYDVASFNTVPTIITENGRQYLLYKSNVNKMTASSYLNIIIVKNNED